MSILNEPWHCEPEAEIGGFRQVVVRAESQGWPHCICTTTPDIADQIVRDHQAALSASPGPEQAGSGEVGRLLHITESMARWLDDDGDTCNRGNPDGGGIYPCDHCTIKEMVTEADAAIAALAQPARGEGDKAAELRKMIVDSANVCTIKGCEHCKWLGFNLGRYESLAALAPTPPQDGPDERPR